MNHKNSGLAHGTSGSPQLTLENGEMSAKAKENETKVENAYTYDHDAVINAINSNNMEFLRNELTRTSPIKIPDTAKIRSEHKKRGYEQVSYKWSNNGYNYESRWHTHVPTAPEYSQDTWVVTRTLPGIPAGKYHRQKETVYLIKNMGWVSSDLWDEAKKLRKLKKETEASRRILDNGHWNVN